MPVLTASSVVEIDRLLSLFPAARLKEKWAEVKGKKHDLSSAIAEQRDHPKMVEFLDENLDCCKQHVYIFSPPRTLNQLPNANITGAERVSFDNKRALYLIKVKFDLILRNPVEEASIEFIWPFRVDIMQKRLVVRFIVLEKNLSSYFGDRPTSAVRRSIEEDSILGEIKGWFNGELEPMDLHKGIKALWKNGFMDASRTRYKKPLSTALEIMDEGKGIKEYYYDLYLVLLKSSLSSTLFQRKPSQRCGVTVFWIEAANGEVDFPRYTEKRGDTDFVIEEIIRNN